MFNILRIDVTFLLRGTADDQSSCLQSRYKARRQFALLQAELCLILVYSLQVLEKTRANCLLAKPGHEMESIIYFVAASRVCVSHVCPYISLSQSALELQALFTFSDDRQHALAAATQSWMRFLPRKHLQTLFFPLLKVGALQLQISSVT